MQPGEGFAQIAGQYGVSAVKLASSNGLTLASVIIPGQRLRVPGHGAPPRPTKATTTSPVVLHTVQPGEGFITIARRYGITAVRLARANGLSLASVISPGQQLRVPGRRASASKAAPPATPPTPIYHTVVAGESFFSIAQRYHVSPWRLAQASHLRLMSTIVPG